MQAKEIKPAIEVVCIPAVLAYTYTYICTFWPRAQHANLCLNKLPLAFLADLQECFARHVLDAWMGLMHELEQLVDNCLQKLPVVAQESRILADHIPAPQMTFLSANFHLPNK